MGEKEAGKMEVGSVGGGGGGGGGCRSALDVGVRDGWLRVRGDGKSAGDETGFMSLPLPASLLYSLSVFLSFCLHLILIPTFLASYANRCTRYALFCKFWMGTASYPLEIFCLMIEPQ